MLNFRALPVKVGDSFLLRVDNQVILVDGGKDETDILKKIRGQATFLLNDVLL